jgi:hypothetical protein
MTVRGLMLTQLVGVLTIVGLYATELRGYDRTTAGWLTVPTTVAMASTTVLTTWFHRRSLRHVRLVVGIVGTAACVWWLSSLDNFTPFGAASSCARELHQRKLTPVAKESDGQFQQSAWLSFDEHPRAGARCRPWPAETRLETRLAAAPTARLIDFVGRGGPQRHVRPIVVIPRNDES